MHAYVDESLRGGDYLLCAVIVEAGEVTRLRQTLKKLLRGHQTRLHMAKESIETKKRLVSHVQGISGISTVLTITSSRVSDRDARDACLEALTSALLVRDLRRMVVESCDQDRRDLQVVGDRLAAARALDSVEITHHRPSEEPMLWLPDIIAWAHGKGGPWRARLAQISIEEIRI